jgi:transposase
MIVATAVAAEIGDMDRFNNPKELMAYLGLVPSEHSSGNAVHRGSITRTGNSHVHRVLVEAAWTYKTSTKNDNDSQAAGGLVQKYFR